MSLDTSFLGLFKQLTRHLTRRLADALLVSVVRELKTYEMTERAKVMASKYW